MGAVFVVDGDTTTEAELRSGRAPTKPPRERGLALAIDHLLELAEQLELLRCAEHHESPTNLEIHLEWVAGALESSVAIAETCCGALRQRLNEVSGQHRAARDASQDTDDESTLV